MINSYRYKLVIISLIYSLLGINCYCQETFVFGEHEDTDAIVKQRDEQRIKCYQENGEKELQQTLINEMIEYQRAALKNQGILESSTLFQAENTCKYIRGEETDKNWIDVKKTPAVEKMTFHYNDLWVKAGWNDTYSKDFDIELPEFWQACKISYKKNWERGNYDEPKHSPILWFNEDNEFPPRFRGYRITLKGSGSHSYFNQMSGGVGIGSVKIVAIRSDLKNIDRYHKGCEMPMKPGTSGTPSFLEEENFEPIDLDLPSLSLGIGKWIYYSKDKLYDVYISDYYFEDDCEKEYWTKVGSIGPDKSYSISLNTGENKYIRLVSQNDENDICNEDYVRLNQKLFVDEENSKDFLVPVKLVN